MCIEMDKCTPLNSLLHLQGLFCNLFFSLTAKSAVRCLKLGAHINVVQIWSWFVTVAVNGFSKSLTEKLEPDL